MSKYGIGQPVLRFEDPRLLRGHGRFINDVNLAGQTHAVFVRSPHAHAKIRSIDIDEAKKSIAIAVTMQPRDKTMTDEEIDAIGAKIVAEVAKKAGGTFAPSELLGSGIAGEPMAFVEDGEDIGGAVAVHGRGVLGGAVVRRHRVSLARMEGRVRTTIGR